MLVIRFQRTGRKNQASFRVIVSPKGLGGPKGKPVEYLGWYNPYSKKFVLKTERIQYWMSQGAKPTATLNNLLLRAKVITGTKIPKNKKSKKAEEPKPAEQPTPAPEAKPEPKAEPAPQAAPEPAPEKPAEPAAPAA